MADIFAIFNISLDNNKTICPFRFHKGGQENSASFNFYPETNSFFCWGCKTGGGAVDFISKMEETHRYDAALSILAGFHSFDAKFASSEYNQNKFHLDFSHSVREFIIVHKDSPKALNHAELLTAAFDNMLSRYHIEDEGLSLLISKLKKKLENFNEK